MLRLFVSLKFMEEMFLIMKKYDVKCPICGTINKSLYLEETHGWMECENCHSTVQVKQIKMESCMVSVLSDKHLLKVIRPQTF